MLLLAIDIGTNTVLATFAASEGGQLRVREQSATITRLGRGVEQGRGLDPERVEATLEALRAAHVRAQALDVSRVAVVGTSALRDARGSAPIRDEVQRLFGCELEVISGQREAELTFGGALSDLPGATRGERVLVFDVGGGSTEIVEGEVGGALGFCTSVDVGSVRHTERHLHGDPPSASELAALRADVRAGLGQVPHADEVVGIAGTVTTLAALSLQLAPYDGAKVHGHVMERAEVERVLQQLIALPFAERAALPGLDPKRADVMIAGGCIVLEVMTAMRATRLRVSDRGVRFGLLAELAQRSG